MLRIYFKTVTAWVRAIEVEGSLKDDLLNLIEQYIEIHPDDLPTYQYEDLQENYTIECIEENYLPINGGEFYIDMIDWIEEL